MAEERVTDSVRALVTERARGCCEYCRCQAAYSAQPFSVEHVMPRKRGGGSSEGNLALSCQGCNNHKYTKTQAPDPIGGELAPLFNPRAQRWRDHFTWSHDASVVIGLTPTGRATVVALQINRYPVVNMRRVLYAHGVHPPPEVD
jgi:hypothetical protein